MTDTLLLPRQQSSSVVQFNSHDVRLTGRLSLPAGPADSPPPPVIIVVGSWMSVKEQMAATYTPYLLQAGYAVLSFDFCGFGGSAGTPREVESAARKAADIRHAAQFLAGHEAVDGRRIGVLAICAGAGHTAMAAPDQPAIRSIAMVAPWLHDQAIVESIYGGPQGVRSRLDQARQARRRFELTGQVDYITAASNTDPTAAMYWPGGVLDYYLNPRRGAIPQWGGRFAVMAWEEWLSWDAIALAPALTVPTRLVTGEGTATPGGARQFAAAMSGPHDLVNLAGGQVDFYDRPEVVIPAAAAAIDHFQRTL